MTALPTPPERYERYGWDYEAFNPSDARAEAWYRRHAKAAGSPVLEVACGTGRLALALAQAGFDVTGLDLTEAMLARARFLTERQPPAVRSRVTWAQADMRDFQLDRRFALAIVADNSLREAETQGGMLGCLRTIRRHLVPSGRLLVTERRFDASRFIGGQGDWPWSDVMVDPETGRSVQRRVRATYDARERRLFGEMVYRERDAMGVESERVLPYSSPVLAPAEYLELLEAAGFESDLRVGYEDRPDDGRSPWLCFVARPA